jgi:DNA polymerase-1
MLKAGHEACISIDKRWKEGRKKAKAINFGFLFGMYEKKFIETCKLKYGFEPTFEEAKRFRAAYFALYRGLTPWHRNQKNLVHLNGYARNLAGRMRRLPGIHSSDKMLRMECERQAINSPVQGFIGDYKAMCLVEIHETLPRDRLRIVGEHHDAILMIVRNDSIDEMCPKIERIMKHPRLLDTFKIELTVPMEAELELGPWGAGKPWKPEKKS